ncbi:MAG TPA: hypothetical protein VKX49_29380 [Bryobacteraceae bacterium]|nr:hypothetical protein [Bryobacteraceae bacterium]
MRGRFNVGLICFHFVALMSGAALAQNNPCHSAQPVSTLGSAPVSQAAVVYDPNQNVCWLADANLAGDAAMRASLGVAGINPNGSMDFPTAQKWVAALNAYGNGSGYLGHNNWQLPVAPLVDKTCADTGTFGGSFGPQCTASALGNLYTAGLSQTFPNSVAPHFAATVGPISNFKLSYYWAAQNNGGTSGTSNGGQETFSFANGIQGGTTINDTYFYVLPMVAGAVGTPPSCAPGSGVIVYSSGPAAGSAVYDCNTGYTWLADANLAALNNFGITGNIAIKSGSRTITAPLIDGGAMLFDTATQWVQAMNKSQYLGSSAWQIPATAKVLQGLFTDLQLAPGDARLMWTGSTGPFQNLQPFFYWACERDASGNSESLCTGYAPPDGASQLQWSFNFDYGFQSTSSIVQKFFVMVYYPVTAPTVPVISLVANAEGEDPTIAPNTWVEIKGFNLAPAGDSRIWASSDFNGGQMPTDLDGVSATVGGKSAYVYYISPTQVDILTPPDAISGAVPVQITNNRVPTASYTALAQALSPSFFLFNGGPYVVATHSNGTLLGPASLYPGSTTPAKPGEVIVLYANGFGPTSAPIISGSVMQSGSLSPEPAIKIGGTAASVQFAGLVSPGLFQFNVVVPPNSADGDQTVTAAYSGAATQSGALLTVQR